MTYSVNRGDSPLVLGFPHGGTQVTVDVAANLNENGLILADTDWHIAKLYDGLVEDVTTVEATFHRYVIDANRDPGGDSLYPGQNTTGLIPLHDFDGQWIWLQEPSDEDQKYRVASFHEPYHRALNDEIQRVKSKHGYAVLIDCHSIRSEIPFLFEGVLPTLNIGTDFGKTCDPAIEAAVMGAIADGPFTQVLNGRFRGGWTTRHYGRPADHVHAVQIEIAQHAYLSEETPPFRYDNKKADELRPSLASILSAVLSAAQ
ncbi:N-formylglutamate deformylase [Loktanella sp. DJP18]|uniref:N-formylglutamate deformylase n=1 Tax=Loktanella sp. DJP18 TaxID=3409788 RepID=UPI003BB51A53